MFDFISKTFESITNFIVNQCRKVYSFASDFTLGIINGTVIEAFIKTSCLTIIGCVLLSVLPTVILIPLVIVAVAVLYIGYVENIKHIVVKRLEKRLTRKMAKAAA